MAEIIKKKYSKSKKLESGIISTIKSDTKNYGMLGREIKISPKSKVNINNPGFKIEFNVSTVDVLIGIGNDHTAYLVMDVAAWEALRKMQSIDITTLKDFKEKFL